LPGSDAAISQYDEREGNRHLPPELHREITKPGLREALAELHQMLVEEQGRLEEGEGNR
jgi:hypothetical protein